MRPPNPNDVVPLIGHRIWKLATPKGEPTLFSVSRPDAWEGPVFHADKAPGLNPVPQAAVNPEASFYPGGLIRHRENHHGIYSLRNRKQLEAQLRRTYSVVSRSSHYLVGSVEMWGRVVEHQNGWRAEHAIIRELHFEVACPCMIQEIRDVVKKLEARYDCPVTVGPLVEQLELQAKGLTPQEWYELTREKTIEEELDKFEHGAFGMLGGLGKGVLWGIGSPVFQVSWAARSLLIPAAPQAVLPVTVNPYMQANTAWVVQGGKLKGIIASLGFLNKLRKLFVK